jgi:hypothetical protein
MAVSRPMALHSSFHGLSCSSWTFLMSVKSFRLCRSEYTPRLKLRRNRGIEEHGRAVSFWELHLGALVAFTRTGTLILGCSSPPAPSSGSDQPDHEAKVKAPSESSLRLAVPSPVQPVPSEAQTTRLCTADAAVKQCNLVSSMRLLDLPDGEEKLPRVHYHYFRRK